MNTKDDIIAALVTACGAYQGLMRRIDKGEDGDVTVMDWRLLDAKIEAALALAKPGKAPDFGKLCETDKTTPIPLGTIQTTEKDGEG